VEARTLDPKEIHSQSKKLDRKKFWNDPIMIAMIVIMTIFLTLFIVYPLVMLLSEALRNADGQFTLQTIQDALTYVTFKQAFINTLQLGLIVGVTSTIVGMLFAYIDVYVKTKTKILAIHLFSKKIGIGTSTLKILPKKKKCPKKSIMIR